MRIRVHGATRVIPSVLVIPSDTPADLLNIFFVYSSLLRDIRRWVGSSKSHLLSSRDLTKSISSDKILSDNRPSHTRETPADVREPPPPPPAPPSSSLGTPARASSSLGTTRRPPCSIGVKGAGCRVYGVWCWVQGVECTV